MQVNDRLFGIIDLPPHQFHLIAALTPFTKAQKRELILLPHMTTSTEQINLVVKDQESSMIAGAAVLRVSPAEVGMQDFYILDRYRRKGAGSMLMEQIESIAREKHIPKINTSKSLHADNHGMIAFLEHKGFVRTPFEVHYFSQPLADHETRITYLDTHDYSYFIPKNNTIVPFSDKYFDPVFEMALDVFNDHPFYSEELIYQTLLLASEKYSQLLVEGNQINGFAIFWTSANNFICISLRCTMNIR